MKKLLLFPLCALLMLACGPTKRQVISLNNKLVEQVSKCSVAEKEFFETCASYNPASISTALKEFAAICQEAKTELDAIEADEELAKLKTASVDLVATYLSLQKEYAEYARLYSIPTENYTEEDEKQTSLTAGKITDTINPKFDAVQEVQKEYSEKYRFKLK